MAVIDKAVGGFASITKACAISDCRAQLLGMNYIVVTLDDGRVIPLCRTCYRKVRAEITAKKKRGVTS